jgi:hypothetical protein
MGHRSEVNGGSPLIESPACKGRGGPGVIGRVRRRMSLAAAAGFAVAAALASPAQAAPPVENVTCGEIVTHSLIVGNDLACMGGVVVIGADYVTLDLGGHTLDSIFFGSPLRLGVTHRWGSAIWMPAQQR